MNPQDAVTIDNLSHSYGNIHALKKISFKIKEGEVLGLVGPNGGGKSTTFKILSTLLRPTDGRVEIFGKDVVKEVQKIRRQIGVVFQHPALDKKLKVIENLYHQGRLYGVLGKALKDKSEFLLKQFGLSDRAEDLVGTLSGGLQRRVELAKCLLHGPKLLILDEPTTGLDPLVRREIWEYLLGVVQKVRMTVLFTTHLLEEAEICSNVVLINRGEILVSGTPGALKESLPGDVVTLRTSEPSQVSSLIERDFKLQPVVLGNTLHLAVKDGVEFLQTLKSNFGKEFDSLSVGKPNLEDVFIQKAGERLS